VLILVLTGFNTFAQNDRIADDRIWSKVELDPNGPGQIDPNFKYDEKPGETKHYFFESGSVIVLPAARPRPGTNTTQSELSIAVHPTDNNIVFCSSNATNWPVTTLWGTGVYWSTDGALTWGGADNPGTLPGFGTNSGDPVSIIGLDGRFYENYISNPGGQGVSVSTNNGANWTTHTVAPNPGSLADKNHYMVDKTAGSPFLHRSYCTWTDFGGANNNQAVIRWSSNFGVNWSSSINLSSTLSPGSHAQGVNVQTAANGDVYVCFAIYDNWPGGEDAIGFAKSTDGGVTWTRNRVYGALTPNGGFNFGIRGTLASKNGIRVSSFPSMAVDRSGGANHGTIYITWTQRTVAPAGNDPDVVLIKSIDGGTTWSAPVRVNDDPINNGKDQYYPWVAVDQATGRVLLVWYDSRDVSNNQAEVFMAHSVDGGSTFENFEVSTTAHSPSPIPGLAGGYAGDYIGVDGYDDIAYPYWAENSTGNYQGWFAEAQFSPPCPVSGPTNPSPANGTGNLPLTGNTLSWTNGAGTTLNEIYFNGALVYDGAAVTSRTLAQLGLEPLTYSTTYNWRVVCKDAGCGTTGPTWSFTTMDDPSIAIAELFCDNFTSGIGNWTITNEGGTCVWQQLTTTSNTYTLPATASGNIIGADSDLCGSGTTLLSTARLNTAMDLAMYTGFPVDAAWIEFDNDWRIIDAADEAHIELSSNGGTTWTSVWSKVGIDQRNSHEIVDLAPFVGQASVHFRLRTVQPGWDWWWAVDNFCVYVEYIVPVELTSFTAAVSENNVVLNWITATETNNQGFEVQRQSGEGQFEKIGYVPGFGTTTETKAYSFTDSKIATGNYTYRLRQVDYDGTFEYSPEVEIEIVAPAEYALEQNYPNPFNPSTTIKYSIAEDGFVRLSVFNLLGEEVATLVNNTQKAGRYEVQFNASELSSGVYIYTIETSSFTSSKKLMLMK
jgi:hypothetical protein